MSIPATSSGRFTHRPGVTEGRWLHVVPKLHLPADAGLGARSSGVRLEVSSAALSGAGVAVVPATGPRVSNPFSDSSYVAGGVDGGLYGWLLPIPHGLQALDLTYTWSVPVTRDRFRGPKELDHRLLLRLRPGETGLYSTDVSDSAGQVGTSSAAWPEGGLYTVAEASQLSAVRVAAGAQLEPIVDWGDPDDPGREAGVLLTEAVDLAPVPWAHLALAERYNGRPYDRMPNGFEP